MTDKDTYNVAHVHVSNYSKLNLHAFREQLMDRNQNPKKLLMFDMI